AGDDDVSEESHGIIVRAGTGRRIGVIPTPGRPGGAVRCGGRAGPRRTGDPPSPGRMSTPNVPSTASAAAPRTEPQGPPENIRLRPVLADLPAYVPGRPPAADAVRRVRAPSKQAPI